MPASVIADVLPRRAVEHAQPIARLCEDPGARLKRGEASRPVRPDARGRSADQPGFAFSRRGGRIVGLALDRRMEQRIGQRVRLVHEELLLRLPRDDRPPGERP